MKKSIKVFGENIKGIIDKEKHHNEEDIQKARERNKKDIRGVDFSKGTMLKDTIKD